MEEQHKTQKTHSEKPLLCRRGRLMGITADGRCRVEVDRPTGGLTVLSVPAKNLRVVDADGRDVAGAVPVAKRRAGEGGNEPPRLDLLATVAN